MTQRMITEPQSGSSSGVLWNSARLKSRGDFPDIKCKSLSQEHAELKLRIFVGASFHPAKEQCLSECFGPGIIRTSVNSELMIEVRLLPRQASHCVLISTERIVSLSLSYLIDTFVSFCCIRAVHYFTIKRTRLISFGVEFLCSLIHKPFNKDSTAEPSLPTILYFPSIYGNLAWLVHFWTV